MSAEGPDLRSASALPTTDALFAQEVERKVSNLLAGLQSLHRAAALKLLNLFPAHRISTLICPGARMRTSM
jgi:hypothetical protein